MLSTEGAAHAGLKVELAKARLSGSHPAEVTVAELEAMHTRRSHWKPLKALVEGDPQRNERARIRAATEQDGNIVDGHGGRLSVEQQVACLLDQATDPNILGRTWEGWKSFV